MRLHRGPVVNQTFVIDILMEVLSLSFHGGTQACREWLFDATALLCGLAPLFPVIRILSTRVFHVLSLVTAP